MRRVIIMLLVLVAAVAAFAGSASTHRTTPARAALSPPRVMIQFGRAGLREMAKIGAVDSDSCTALPDSKDVGYAGNGTVALYETGTSPVFDRLDARYSTAGGTNPWSGFGVHGNFAATINTAMVYPGVFPAAGYSQEACGSHSTKLNAINVGSILYPSWSDLQQFHNTAGTDYVSAGNSPGGSASGGSPYEDGTWTDIQIANNILNAVNGSGGSGTGTAIGSGDNHTNTTTNSLGMIGHGYLDGEAEMAWPEGPPGCFTGGTGTPQCAASGCPSAALLCPVKDSSGDENLPPDEVARRMAQGCVAGQSHTSYSGTSSYVTDCDVTYSPIVSMNRRYSTNTASAMNTDPWIGAGSTGKCAGSSGENGCYYVRVLSLVGGKCTSTTDSCHTVSVPSTGPFGGRTCTTTGLAGNCYMLPSQVISTIDTTATAGGSYVLQPYRFVEGAYTDTINTTPKKSWNCNGAESTHWTSVPETYCWNDFLTIMDEFSSKGYTLVPASWWDTNYGRGVIDPNS